MRVFNDYFIYDRQTPVFSRILVPPYISGSSGLDKPISRLWSPDERKVSELKQCVTLPEKNYFFTCWNVSTASSAHFARNSASPVKSFGTNFTSEAFFPNRNMYQTQA